MDYFSPTTPSGFNLIRSGCLLATLALLGGFPAPIAAQTQIGERSLSTAAEIDDTTIGFRAGSFVAAPIPLKNPTLGSGLILGAGYLFDIDEGSDTSFFGLAGFRTDNGSQGYGLAGNFALSNNRWKFGFLAGEVDVFYDLYLLNLPVPLRQSGSLINFDGSYGFTPHISAGLDMRYLETTISLDLFDGTVLPDALIEDANLALFNLGLTFDVDYRDDTIFPTSGTHLDFSHTGGWTVEGQSRAYRKTVAKLDYYQPVFNKSVLAVRLAGCAATEDAPFYDQCSLGGTDSFRGYASTKFIDQNLLSAQIEFRAQVSDRIGLALFGGAGSVSESFGNLTQSDRNYAAGLGARYRLSKKFPLDFAVDGAINADDEKTIYIYVGQRF